MNYVKLGKNIRKYRQIKEMRQSDLAELCGCSNSFIGFIGQIENARTSPSLDTVVDICNVLGVTVDQLLLDDYEHPELVYLKEVNERMGKYLARQRILLCEKFIHDMDFLDQFEEPKK